MSETKALEVHITAPDKARAIALARALVDERLAACVNIVPAVVSIYRWEGRLHEDDEVLCLVKTTAEQWPALLARVEELHPYAVPEVLAFAVAEGGPRYLGWLADAVGPGTKA